MLQFLHYDIHYIIFTTHTHILLIRLLLQWTLIYPTLFDHAKIILLQNILLLVHTENFII